MPASHSRFGLSRVGLFRVGLVASLMLWLVPLWMFPALAETAVALDSQRQEADAEALLKKIDELYRSESSVAVMIMEIVTPNWRREMQMQAWTVGMDDTFIRVLSPKKDRGVATLKKAKEMWNYFPKINKVIKVPPSMMMGSWMGSDFTNDDLVREASLVDDYHVSLNSSGAHHQFTLTPKQQTVTVWGKIEISADKTSLLPIEQVYFNEKGERVRVMSFSDVRTFSGRKLPSVMTMTPLNKDNHKTIIRYTQLQLDVPVEETIFTLRHLKRRFR